MTRLGAGGDRGKDRLSSRFVEPAEDASLVVQRTISLRDLAPDRYLLRMTVSEEGAKRSVTPSGPGTSWRGEGSKVGADES